MPFLNKFLLCTFIMLFSVEYSYAQEKYPENTALQNARTFLYPENQSVKDQAGKDLADFKGDILKIIGKLRPAPSKKYKQGFSGTEYFNLPQYHKKYGTEHLYYFVPSSYNPEKPAGLLVFLCESSPESPKETAEAEFSNYIAWGDYIKKNPFIAVAPSMPGYFKELWSSQGNAEYISAVIEEISCRFNIDPDKVVLAGNSAGASGAYSLALTMPDRFSAVLAHSGSWKAAYWKASTGTPLYIVHGSHDAVPPGNPWREHRPKITDIKYARLADSLLTVRGVEHTFVENSNGHYQWEAFSEVSAFFEYMQTRERNPFEKHVVAATPADGSNQSPNNRWITILETGSGSIPIDTTETFGKMSMDETADEFLKSHIAVGTRRVNGGIVDAENAGNNVFVITTQNVKSFELWLNPSMADFSKPITVILNRRQILLNANESIVTALLSFERRRDWGLIYTAKVTLRP